MHSLSYVVPFDEHTGSSYDGQLSTHMQRASNASNALQTAKCSHVTLMHGSGSWDSIKYNDTVSLFPFSKLPLEEEFLRQEKIGFF